MIISDKDRVFVGQGDMATEWTVVFEGEEYVRQKHYDVTWKRKGVEAGNGKYPDEETQQQLETLFRSCESVFNDGTSDSEEG